MPLLVAGAARCRRGNPRLIQAVRQVPPVPDRRGASGRSEIAGAGRGIAHLGEPRFSCREHRVGRPALLARKRQMEDAIEASIAETECAGPGY